MASGLKVLEAMLEEERATMCGLYGTLSAGQRAAVLAVARSALAATASLTMVSQRCEPYGNRAASGPAVEVRERRGGMAGAGGEHRGGMGREAVVWTFLHPVPTAAYGHRRHYITGSRSPLR